MRRVLTVAAAVVGGLLVVVAALFGYYIYTPLPKLPVLAGHALSATLDFDKHRRHYIQYAPAGLPQGSPLVIVLHGALMNGASMRRLMDEKFDVLADRRRFVVIIPMRTRATETTVASQRRFRHGSRTSTTWDLSGP